MLSQEQRTAILELHRQGHSARAIAKSLSISRTTVKKVIRSQSKDPPPMIRPRKAEPHREEILELYARCASLVRVHEELQSQGVEISYPALTEFCREEGIHRRPVVPSGHYPFAPGQEMQHDTSPHRVKIGGRSRVVQTAAGVLCYSRMIFAQCYPRFRRFECKSFLTEAMRFFGGVAEVTMIDNTHVVVLVGTGKTMVPVPEMEAFSQRFGFRFVAHEKGDANRSAHVERSFWHIESNFFAGREFSSWEDLNQQLRSWCEKVNASYKRHLKARPTELFAAEKIHLRPLPGWIPEPYLVHQRMVDQERYVTLDTNRYSVPVEWIGHRVQVRETQRQITIERNRRTKSVIHVRIPEPCGKRSTLPEHRFARGQGRKRKGAGEEEKKLREIAPELLGYVADLKKKSQKQLLVLVLRQFLRMVREYPREPLRRAVNRAARYGLYDLDRVERMVLRFVAEDYFRLDPNRDDDPDPEGDDDD